MRTSRRLSATMASMEPKRRGRPELPPEERRIRLGHVRVHPDTLERLRRLAAAHDVSMGVVVDRLVADATATLAEAEPPRQPPAPPS